MASYRHAERTVRDVEAATRAASRRVQIAVPEWVRTIFGAIWSLAASTIWWRTFGRGGSSPRCDLSSPIDFSIKAPISPREI
jgi:hypothetical protein